MTIHDISELLTALGVIGTLCVAVFNARLSTSNARKIEEVHKATNSMKDELVAATRSESHAAGVAEGTIAEQTRIAEMKGS